MKPNEIIVEVDFTEDEERISVGGRNIEIPQVVFLKPVKEWFEPGSEPPGRLERSVGKAAQ